MKWIDTVVPNEAGGPDLPARALISDETPPGRLRKRIRTVAIIYADKHGQQVARSPEIGKLAEGKDVEAVKAKAEQVLLGKGIRMTGEPKP